MNVCTLHIDTQWMLNALRLFGRFSFLCLFEVVWRLSWFRSWVVNTWFYGCLTCFQSCIASFGVLHWNLTLWGNTSPLRCCWVTRRSRAKWSRPSRSCSSEPKTRTTHSSRASEPEDLNGQKGVQVQGSAAQSPQKAHTFWVLTKSYKITKSFCFPAPVESFRLREATSLPPFGFGTFAMPQALRMKRSIHP